jgi:hypothetical protein
MFLSSEYLNIIRYKGNYDEKGEYEWRSQLKFYIQKLFLRAF